MTDPTKAIKHRWAGVLDRLAQGPDGYGPHDIEALCGALQRVVEERDEARAEVERLRRLALQRMEPGEVPAEPEGGQ